MNSWINAGNAIQKQHWWNPKCKSQGLWNENTNWERNLNDRKTKTDGERLWERNDLCRN